MRAACFAGMTVELDGIANLKGNIDALVNMTSGLWGAQALLA